MSIMVCLIYLPLLVTRSVFWGFSFWGHMESNMCFTQAVCAAIIAATQVIMSYIPSSSENGKVGLYMPFAFALALLSVVATRIDGIGNEYFRLIERMFFFDKAFFISIIAMLVVVILFLVFSPKGRRQGAGGIPLAFACLWLIVVVCRLGAGITEYPKESEANQLVLPVL